MTKSVLMAAMALITTMACQSERALLLAGDIADDGSIVPCVGVSDPEGCGAAIYHTRHIGLVNNGMSTKEVMATMHSPTIFVGGGPEDQLCYSVVFFPTELRCFLVTSGKVSGYVDRDYSELPLEGQ